MADITYFLPCALKSALEHETARSLTVTEVTAEVDGFKIPGYALSGEFEDLATFVTKATLDFGMHQIYAATGTQVLFARDTILIGDTPHARLAAKSTAMQSIDVMRSDLGKLRPLVDDLLGTLDQLSDYTGLEFILDLRDGGFAPIFPRNRKNLVHIVMGASAPGEVVPLRASHFCNTELMRDGSELKLDYGPSSGSGTVVYDDGKELVGQVVENSLFVFAPLGVQFARVLREKDGIGLFKKMLRYVWNIYVTNPKGDEPTLFGSPEDYAESIETWLDFYPSIKRSMVKAAERDMHDAYKEYLSKLRNVQWLRAGLQDGIAVQQNYDRELARSDWERLSSNPLLKSFGKLDKGFQAITQPIISEFDGVRYRLGSYHIRIALSGHVAVWSEEATHPGGIAHPHIGWSGNPCFGNISIAIERAGIERRIADAIDLVLRWLIEGYDPGLAETPITEWPKEVEA
jgi:hypothetical protein